MLVLFLLLVYITMVSSSPCPEFPEPMWVSFDDLMSFMKDGGSICDSSDCVRLRAVTPHDLMLQLNGMTVKVFKQGHRMPPSMITGRHSMPNDKHKLAVLTWMTMIRAIIYGIANGLSHLCRSRLPDHMHCLS